MKSQFLVLAREAGASSSIVLNSPTQNIVEGSTVYNHYTAVHWTEAVTSAYFREILFLGIRSRPDFIES
jgi:hypothetical protein